MSAADTIVERHDDRAPSDRDVSSPTARLRWRVALRLSQTARRERSQFRVYAVCAEPAKRASPEGLSLDFELALRVSV